jgi:hypothetical protein
MQLNKQQNNLEHLFESKDISEMVIDGLKGIGEMEIHPLT